MHMIHSYNHIYVYIIYADVSAVSYICMHIYPTQSITELSPSPWGCHLIDSARRSTFSFFLAANSLSHSTRRGHCAVKWTSLGVVCCPATSLFRARVSWMRERGRDGGNGRRSFWEGKVMSMLGSFSLSLSSFLCSFAVAVKHFRF